MSYVPVQPVSFNIFFLSYPTMEVPPLLHTTRLVARALWFARNSPYLTRARETGIPRGVLIGQDLCVDDV